MAVAEKHPVVVSPEQYKIAYWMGQGKTAAESRKEIVKKLQKNNLGIATEVVSAQRASSRLLGGPLPSASPTNAVVDGITWAWAFYNGSDNTGKIENGNHVVFDTVTGFSVTGINSKWMEDEFYIVGIAYDSLTTQGTKRIPIKLIPPFKQADAIMRGKTTVLHPKGQTKTVRRWTNVGDVDTNTGDDYQVLNRGTNIGAGKVVYFTQIGSKLEIISVECPPI